MLLFGLSLLVAITAGLFLIIDYICWDFDSRHEFLSGLLWFTFVTSLIVFLVIVICLPVIRFNFEETKLEYQYTTELIKNTDSDSYSVIALTKEAIRLNNEIARHKAKYKNQWVGAFYCADIANLEPIKIVPPANEPEEKLEESEVL